MSSAARARRTTPGQFRSASAPITGNIVPTGPRAQRNVPTGATHRRRNPPANRSSTSHGVSRNPENVRHLTCYYWASRGFCTRGNQCAYRHDFGGRAIADRPQVVGDDQVAKAGNNYQRALHQQQLERARVRTAETAETPVTTGSTSTRSNEPTPAPPAAVPSPPAAREVRVTLSNGSTSSTNARQESERIRTLLSYVTNVQEANKACHVQIETLKKENAGLQMMNADSQARIDVLKEGNASFEKTYTESQAEIDTLRQAIAAYDQHVNNLEARNQELTLERDYYFQEANSLRTVKQQNTLLQNEINLLLTRRDRDNIWETPRPFGAPLDRTPVQPNPFGAIGSERASCSSTKAGSHCSTGWSTNATITTQSSPNLSPRNESGLVKFNREWAEWRKERDQMIWATSEGKTRAGTDDDEYLPRSLLDDEN